MYSHRPFVVEYVTLTLELLSLALLCILKKGPWQLGRVVALLDLLGLWTLGSTDGSKVHLPTNSISHSIGLSRLVL